MRKFTTWYRSAYGRPPENAFPGLGFDAINLVANQGVVGSIPTWPTTSRCSRPVLHPSFGCHVRPCRRDADETRARVYGLIQ